ncbi:polysaccharide biosynthesis tyrosine autokinase [Microbacterium barkeri]
MELQDYLRILRKNWIAIIVATLVGLGGGAVATAVTPPTYQASTDLYVSVRGGSSTGELVQGGNFSRQIIASYASIVDSAAVLDPVIEELNLGVSANQLGSRVSASSPADTVLLTVRVVGDEAQEVADIANAVGASFTKVVQEQLEGSGGGAAVQLTTVQPASVPNEPVTPKLKTNLAFGLALGLLAGIAFAAIRALLDNRVRSQRDIEQATDASVLGVVVQEPEANERPLIVHADPRSPRAESFRSLRTNLQFVQASDGQRSFVVASPELGDDKGITATNLAISLAESGARVVLIDADLRRPSIHELMDLDGSVGLTDVLISQTDLADALQRWGRRQLYVLPAGKMPPNPSELLGSKAMSQMLRELAEHFDYVLIDAPPLLLVTDAVVVSRHTRGLLLTVSSGGTRKQELSAAVRAIDAAGAKLVGLVVTNVPVKGPERKGFSGYGSAALEEYGASPAKESADASSRQRRRRAAR